MVSVAVGIAIPVVATMCLIRKIREWSYLRHYDEDTSSLEGKVFLVTGANSGIGKETCRELAKRKAKVIMACRNITSAQEAIADIRRSTADGELIPMVLDLASFASIKKFADEVLKTCAEIHVLINNAGVSYPKGEYHKTEDGFEVHVGVNYLGHFLLTNLLLDRIKASAPSRIVNVSSALYKNGVLDLDNFDGVKEVTRHSGHTSAGYCDSKLYNIYHTKELSRRLQGSGVDANAVCPGWCWTPLARHHNMKWYHYLLAAPIAFCFLHTASYGAKNVLFVATSRKVSGVSGQLFQKFQPDQKAAELNSTLAIMFWDKTQQLISEKLSEQN